MLTQWRLENFKSVYDRSTLDLAPLTLFAGINSSGKSTFIQAMLLVAQTVTSRVERRPIILNGHLARLGTFEDIASSGSQLEEISVGFTLEPHKAHYPPAFYSRGIREHAFMYHGVDLAKCECDFTFSAATDAPSDELARLHPELDKVLLSVFSEDEATPSKVEIHRTTKTAEERATELGVSVDHVRHSPNVEQSLAYEVVSPRHYIGRRARYFLDVDRNPRIAGCSFSHFWPNSLTVLYDRVTAGAAALVEALLEPRARAVDADPELLADAAQNRAFRSKLVEALRTVLEPGDMPISSNRLAQLLKFVERLEKVESPDQLSEALGAIPHMYVRRAAVHHQQELVEALRGDKEPVMAFRLAPPTEAMSTAASTISSLFGGLFKYLGPLRDEPKPVYPSEAMLDPGDVGLKGEYTAAVLDLYKSTLVEYVPTAAFDHSNPRGHKLRGSLQEAVLDWLSYMGVLSGIETRDLGKLGHTLQVSASEGDELYDLTHVGVGVSQVLPILVLSLLAPEGSTLVFEQPELHLHPRVQALLGDFFLSMAMTGRQCIVETHSEYLINRIRYRAATESTDVAKGSIPQITRMYFVERIDRKSTYQPIGLNEFGAIDNWPAGFFDEAQRQVENILRAALTKRRSHQEDDR
jgi:predicted ATPase